jgi:alpha-glutamyl/putrescinyl thymine pyrophosphorylase clade 1
MFLHDNLGGKLLGAKSLREIYGLLRGYPLMGDFMSYQTTIDVNYSSLTAFSENEFTQAVPGALRGIKKVFDSPGDYTPYCRETAPELASARKRIKARFTATPEPVRLLFPPKWGINDQLPDEPVYSRPQAQEQAALF